MKSTISCDMISICPTARWRTLGGSRWQQRLPLLDQVLCSGGKCLIFSFSSQLVDVLAQARCLKVSMLPMFSHGLFFSERSTEPCIPLPMQSLGHVIEQYRISVFLKFF